MACSDIAMAPSSTSDAVPPGPVAVSFHPPGGMPGVGRQTVRLPSGASPDCVATVVAAMEDEFGPCSSYGECAQVCPESIPLTAIAAVNREVMRARLRGRAD
mgnify:CR=1 FL=1